MKSATAHPFYINSIANINLYDMDYNNMYAPQYVACYTTTNVNTIADWQSIVPSDKHSVSVDPDFTDATVNLKLNKDDSLSCPLYPEIITDIEDFFRAEQTTMGAYVGSRPYLDLSIEAITCNAEVSYPQFIPVEIKIKNTGENDNIDSATFGWSINGNVQPFYPWTTASNPLGLENSKDVVVGSFNPAGQSNIFDIVVWVESVNGRKDSIVWNDTVKISIKALYTGSNLSLQSIERLVPEDDPCINDYTSLKTVLANTGTLDCDFDANPVRIYVEVTQPKPFYLDTLISSGILRSGEVMPLTLTDTFPIVIAGDYDIKVWMDSISSIVYDDTSLVYYVSGKFKLPLDEDFSGNILPIAFVSKEINTADKWEVVAQGTGIDASVTPQFGTGMLAFKGSPGSVSTLTTQQLDLSLTEKPSLSFWYFHDTIPCEDYTDVYLTVDGTTYSTLFALAKYDTVYGWKQYSKDLPDYAVNQCVRIVFEAMEKSRNGDVTQYIDRIRVTAKQDIELKNIFTSELSACDLQNKEWKVVLKNNEDPDLDYSITPIDVTLEIAETGEIFTQRLTSDILEGFASDTVIFTPTVNFAKGTYSVKAYFTSILDVDRDNDTSTRTIVINPEIVLQINPASGGTTNCLAGETDVLQSVVITNTGDMDLSDIELILQVETDDNPAYAVIKEICRDTILKGNSVTYTFKTAYKSPWKTLYYPRVYAYLVCDSALIDTITAITECVDAKDLYVLKIDNPSSSVDRTGSSVQVQATVGNRDDLSYYEDLDITVVVTNSQGVEMDRFTEKTGRIGVSSTATYNFTQSYTVPNDTVYYLTVYINSYDNYLSNDTSTIKRTTDYTAINAIESAVCTLGQNIPNPATNSTRIDYSIPASGEVIFHVHSISGQLLYSQSIDTKRGTNSIELNTTTFAAGVYFYSMEYKGQKQVRQLIIK